MKLFKKKVYFWTAASKLAFFGSNMTIKELKTYEDLEKFLRNWSNAGGDPLPYDFNGLLHLMLAIVDNMKTHGMDSDLEDYATAITDDQAAYLQKMLSIRANTIDVGKAPDQ